MLKFVLVISAKEVVIHGNFLPFPSYSYTYIPSFTPPQTNFPLSPHPTYSFTNSQGDSGGPMIQYSDSGEPVLVGIVSSGRQCALPDFPGIYIRTAAFSTWMETDTSLVFSRTTATSPIFMPSTSLSTGAIAGIVVGAIIVVVALVAILITVRRRKAAINAASASPATAPIPPPATQAAVGAGYASPSPLSNTGGGGGASVPAYMPALMQQQPTQPVNYTAQPPPPVASGYGGLAPLPPLPPVQQPVGAAPYTEQVYASPGTQPGSMYPGAYGSTPMVYANVSAPPATPPAVDEISTAGSPPRPPPGQQQ